MVNVIPEIQGSVKWFLSKVHSAAPVKTCKGLQVLSVTVTQVSFSSSHQITFKKPPCCLPHILIILLYDMRGGHLLVWIILSNNWHGLVYWYKVIVWIHKRSWVMAFGSYISNINLRSVFLLSLHFCTTKHGVQLFQHHIYWTKIVS